MKLLFVCRAAEENDSLKCPSWIKSIITNISDDFSVTVLSCDGSADASEVSLSGRSVELIHSPLSAPVEEYVRLLGIVEPDAVIIFGTEKNYTLKLMNACKEADMLDRAALFAQGISLSCYMHYAQGVPDKVVGRWTFRDLIRRSNILTEKNKMKEQAEHERTAVSMTRNFIGRTTLDKALLRLYNPSAKYYHCSDLLRTSFYEGEWSLDRCIHHRIFVSQFYYPLKGFHYLLRAAARLKEKYPDLKIAAAGYNPIERSLTQRELKDGSYIKYIKKLIKEYDLCDNIELLGELDEKRMKEEYLKAHVFVMPSTIENSPNSLAEAMMLGVPCVASDVGGVTDLAEHRRDAYIYPSADDFLLAYYIDRVFDDPAEAGRLSKSGRLRAGSEYEPEKNIRALESAFREIAGKEE